ncbi:hypothetical protein D3C87_1698850 [compost metagenome]
MTFPFFFTRSPKRDSLIDNHIITDLTGLPDDDTHSVVNKQTVADGCPRMNFNTGHKSANLGNDAGKCKPSPFVKRVSYPVCPNGMKSSVGEDNLKPAAGCGIVVEYCPNVRLDMLKHHGSPLL